MNKKMKISIIVAIILIVIGSAAFCTAMAASGWDFTIISTVKYETNAYDVVEMFENISIDSRFDSIKFVKSESEECKVVCQERDKVKHSVFVEDGTLNINVVDERKWYEYIGIDIGNSQITIYLPENEYNDLEIKCDTGDVELPSDFTFGNIDMSISTGDCTCLASANENIKIKTSTGDIKLKDLFAESIELMTSTGDADIADVKCEGDLKIEVSTGEVYFKNVVVLGAFKIETDTGDVNMDASDADEIYIETDTGDVKGSLLSEKVFIVDSDTGSIDVPKTISGGRCEIKTDTGDIIIDIE